MMNDDDDNDGDDDDDYDERPTNREYQASQPLPPDSMHDDLVFGSR